MFDRTQNSFFKPQRSLATLLGFLTHGCLGARSCVCVAFFKEAVCSCSLDIASWPFFSLPSPPFGRLCWLYISVVRASLSKFLQTIFDYYLSQFLTKVRVAATHGPCRSSLSVKEQCTSTRTQLGSKTSVETCYVVWTSLL